MTGDTQTHNQNTGEYNLEAQPPTECNSCKLTSTELLSPEEERNRPYESKYDVISFPGLSQNINDADAIEAQKQDENMAHRRGDVESGEDPRGGLSGSTCPWAPDLVPRQMRVAKYEDGHWDDECEEDGGSEREGGNSDVEDDTCERLRSIDFLVFGLRDPGLTSLGRAHCTGSSAAFQELAHRGIRTPIVRFLSDLERTHETDKLLFQGIDGSKYSSYPIVIKDFREMLHTYPTDIATARETLAKCYLKAFIPPNVGEEDTEFDCFKCRTRLANAINSLTDVQRLTRGFRRTPMARKSDTRRLKRLLKDKYERDGFSELGRIPLDLLVETEEQLRIRAQKGRDVVLDLGLEILDILQESCARSADSAQPCLTLGEYTHGRIGAALLYRDQHNFSSKETWAAVSERLGPLKRYLERGTEQRGVLQNAEYERRVTYNDRRSDPAVDTSPADTSSALVWIDKMESDVHGPVTCETKLSSKVV